MELDAIWKRAVHSLGPDVGEHDLAAWVGAIEPTGLKDGAFLGKVPSRLHLERIRASFRDHIAGALGRVLGHDVEIHLSVREPIEEAASRPSRWSQRAPYTFETFVVGESNTLAVESARAVCGAPGSVYNPLFVHGGVGVGKTHLANALGNAIARRSNRPRIQVLSAERFANSIIRGFRSGTVERELETFRKCDGLIVDDVQFLSRKGRLQEEFIRVFNVLREADKAIVLAGDQDPSAIPDLADRLRSRFQSGLIVEIRPPDLELRREILRVKAAHAGIELPDDVVDLLAHRLARSVRELEGVLQRITAALQVTSRAIDLSLVRGLLGPVLRRPEKRTVEAIRDHVAARTGLTPEDLVGAGRSRRLVRARQMGMYLARHSTGASFAEVGMAFGRRHHSTVVHAIKAIDGAKSRDDRLARLLRELEGEI